MKLLPLILSIILSIIKYVLSGANLTATTLPILATQFQALIGNKTQNLFENFVNRTCINYLSESNAYTALPQIAQNELCFNLMFDFTSDTADFQCNSFICNSLSTGNCTYNYINKFAYCENCSASEGAYCIYDSTSFQSMYLAIFEYTNLIQNMYNNLANNSYIINNYNDLQGYLTILKWIIPFYSTSFLDNYNQLFGQVDLLNKILFESANFTNLTMLVNIDVNDIDSQNTYNATYYFIDYILKRAVFSFDFDYLRFINMFVYDVGTSANQVNFGKTSVYINWKNDQVINIGNTKAINSDNYATSNYYGTGGLDNLNLQISVSITKGVSAYLYNKYYYTLDSGAFAFKIKYVLSFVFNPRNYYYSGGPLVKTPIVSIRAYNSNNTQIEYEYPSGYGYINITLPWSNEYNILYTGDYSTNCYIVQYNEIAKQWYPTYDSYIDSDYTDKEKVIFYVSDFGSYAVNCDYTIQRQYYNTTYDPLANFYK